jgi:hypothetical protein
LLFQKENRSYNKVIDNIVLPDFQTYKIKNTKTLDALFIVDEYFAKLISPEDETKEIAISWRKDEDLIRSKILEIIKEDDLKYYQIDAMAGITRNSVGLFLSNKQSQINKLKIYKWYLRYLKNPTIYQETFKFTSRLAANRDTILNEKNKELEKKNHFVANENVITIVKEMKSSATLENSLNLSTEQKGSSKLVDEPKDSISKEKNEIRIRVVQENELFPLNPILINYWNNFTHLGVLDQDFNW